MANLRCDFVAPNLDVDPVVTCFDMDPLSQDGQIQRASIPITGEALRCTPYDEAQSIEFGDVFQLETILGENYWHGYVKVDFLDPWDGVNPESYMAIDFIELAVNKDSLGGFGVNPEDRRFEEIRIGDIDGFGWGDGAALAAHDPAVASANDDLVNLPNKLPVNRDGFGLLASGDLLPDIDADGKVEKSATGLEPGDDWDRRSGEEVEGTFYTGSGFTRSAASFFQLGSQYTDITLSKSYSASGGETDPVLTGDLERVYGAYPATDGNSNVGSNLPGQNNNNPFYFNFYVDPFAIDPEKPLYLTLTHGDLDTSLIEVEVRDIRANSATATLMAAGTTDDGAIESSFVVLDETTLEFDDIFTWDAARNKWHGYLEVRFKNIGATTDEYFAIDFLELSTNMRNIGVLRVPEDYETVQGAIDAALFEGTTILVAPGTYVENIDTGFKNIVLRSHDPLDPATVATTILDGNTDSGAADDGPVITLSGGQTGTSAVRGFTIQNGEAVMGGGIWGRFSEATIEHNVIEDNVAAYGGGIALSRGLVNNNVIRDNEAIVDATIDEGEPSDPTGVGGGVYGASELWENEIYDNSAVIGGGGIWDNVRPNRSRLVNNLIHGNVVTNTGLANAPGAGVHMSERSVGAVLMHNTLVDNTWGVAGDVVNAIDESELATFRNNLLWDTTELSEAPDTDWDRLQGSNLSFNGITGAPDKGQDSNWNFGDDPLFVNAATGDYRLQSSSPAIDAGRELTPAIPSDIAGAPRAAATPDAGAFEKGNGGTAQQYVVILDIDTPTVGDSVTLTARLSPTLQALVTGGATLTWQWEKNGSAISGATSATFTLNPVALSDGGGYQVTATINALAHESMAYALVVNASEEEEGEEGPSSDGLILSPRHLAFGFVPQYGEVTRTVSISNYSAGTISGTAEITEGPFAIAFGTVPWAYNLAPGESTTIYVRAVPDGAGEFTGRLVFSSGEEVTLSCHTATNNAEGAEIAVYPSLVDFGYVAAETSEYRVVTVQNIGTDLLEGAAIATAPFTVAPAEYSLIPGETTIITIGFHPDAAGDFEGQLTFSGGRGKGMALYGTSNEGSTVIVDGIRINEAAPWNTGGIQDSYGSYSDWIELYNENDQAVDLGGWVLTDDPGNTTSYSPLPVGTVIPAHGFLVAFATPETSPPAGEFHTGFELDEVNGGHIGLYNVAEVQVSTMDYPSKERENWSYVFLENTTSKSSAGSSGWTLFPTPKMINVGGEPEPGYIWWLRFKASQVILPLLNLSDPGDYERPVKEWIFAATDLIKFGTNPPTISGPKQCDIIIALEHEQIFTGLKYPNGAASGYTSVDSDKMQDDVFAANRDADVLLLDRFVGKPREFGIANVQVENNGYPYSWRAFIMYLGSHGGDNPVYVTLAHELGHFAGLGTYFSGPEHHGSPTNVMYKHADVNSVLVTQCQCDLYQGAWYYGDGAYFLYWDRVIPPNCH